ncbi:MAG: hypothetical protein K0R08_160 [Solimicrobium sp.]|jgi:hypothetical protein|nr:hypothetical protein [Solimicrobium sp.]
MNFIDIPTTSTTVESVSAAELRKSLIREASLALNPEDTLVSPEITLRTILRGLSAPVEEEPEKYGADHFNGGKGIIWNVGAGFSQMFDSGLLNFNAELKAQSRIIARKQVLLKALYENMANAICRKNKAPQYIGNSIIIDCIAEQGRMLTLTTLGHEAIEFRFGDDREVLKITMENLQEKLTRYVTNDYLPETLQEGWPLLKQMTVDERRRFLNMIQNQLDVSPVKK